MENISDRQEMTGFHQTRYRQVDGPFEGRSRQGPQIHLLMRRKAVRVGIRVKVKD